MSKVDLQKKINSLRSMVYLLTAAAAITLFIGLWLSFVHDQFDVLMVIAISLGVLAFVNTRSLQDLQRELRSRA